MTATPTLFETVAANAVEVSGLPHPSPRPYAAMPENVELVIRDEILADLAALRRSILDWLHPRIVRLYRQRLAAQGYERAYVCADDLRIILDADPRIPPPERLNRNFLGSFWRTPGWRPLGATVKSRTPGSHANKLECWRWEPDDGGRHV